MYLINVGASDIENASTVFVAGYLPTEEDREELVQRLNEELVISHCLIDWVKDPMEAFGELVKLRRHDCIVGKDTILILVSMGAMFLPLLRERIELYGFKVMFLNPYLGLTSLGIPHFIPRVLVYGYLLRDYGDESEAELAMLETEQLVYGEAPCADDFKDRVVVCLKDDDVLKVLKFDLLSNASVIYFYNNEKHKQLGPRCWQTVRAALSAIS